MAIPLKRIKRHKIIGNATSPLLNYLVRVPASHAVKTIDDLASEIETAGSLTIEDIRHVTSALIRRAKGVLSNGDRLKIDGLGTLYVTFACTGTEEEKDCTVKNIHRVNIRFAVDNTFRLTNDSTATTRGGANNVKFYIKTNKAVADGGNQPGGNDDENEEDPTA